MAQSDHTQSYHPRRMGLGTSFAAGGMMLSHLNRSGLSRYEDLMADLAKLSSHSARPPERADRPQRQRLNWVSWIYR